MFLLDILDELLVPLVLKTGHNGGRSVDVVECPQVLAFQRFAVALDYEAVDGKNEYNFLFKTIVIYTYS